MMSFNPSPSTSATATWTPPLKLEPYGSKRRQQNATLAVHLELPQPCSIPAP